MGINFIPHVIISKSLFCFLLVALSTSLLEATLYTVGIADISTLYRFVVLSGTAEFIFIL